MFIFHSQMLPKGHVARVEEKEFVIDTSRGLVHRRSRATAACALDEIPPAARQERATELDAAMVMKTRHYKPCPHCDV